MISALFAALLAVTATGNVTNKLLTVDQRGRLNTSGVATVENVVSNAVKAQVAQASAQAALDAAAQVDEDTTTIAGNIVSNKVVIYRGADAEGFEATVVITDADKLASYQVELMSYNPSTHVGTFRFRYVCLADIASVKPTLHVCEHLEDVSSREEFDIVNESDVAMPTKVSTPIEIGGTTYQDYYETTFSVTLTYTPDRYFIYVSVSGDTPGGGGAGINLPHGAKGGFTGHVGNGWDIDFVGGLAMEGD